jgi:glycosyltransferase involved in cell wall biosynthesis
LSGQVKDIKPDLIHAMRIPFEGMLAASLNPSCPLIVSVWGNDFTLHASASPWMASLTRRTLFRADGLHVDCHRDQRLALEWDYPQDRPLIVLPGAGGIKRDVFYPLTEVESAQGGRMADIVSGIPEAAQVVVNPRGFRAYVRNDTFFRAVPLILQERPETYFLCPTMEGENRAEAWLEAYKIRHAVQLLPRLSPEEMAFVFRRAQVAVSPSEHDGTPNTLLEAMACGSFPVAGDLESVREWIDDGVNGILIDPDHEDSLAKAVLKALEDSDLRRRASAHNLKLIQERADYDRVMLEAETFYSSLIP